MELMQRDTSSHSSDRGQGGKYLILPPGYEAEVPDGYIAMPAATRRTYALLRSNLSSGSEADVAAALAYGRRVKLYPLSQAGDPPPTTFVDAADVVFDSTIPYDVRLFEALDRCVQAEPWLTRIHTLMRDLPWSSRSSNTPGLQASADGSVEIFFGPQPPPNRKENWIPTKPGGAFEVIFRFYGPEKPLFDKTWRLPDIQSA
jgi:hypothetical protein